MVEAVVLTLAYCLDRIIGDPEQLPHPVRGIGWAIEKTEKMLRRNLEHSRLRRPAEAGTQSTEHRTQNTDKEQMTKKLKEKKAGMLLVMIIAGTTYGLFYFVNAMLLAPHLPVFISFLSFILLIYLVSTTIATRELLRSGRDVIEELNSGDIEDARNRLGMIVGRETKSLEEKGILRAVIETLSENASDGIIAPLFYYAIGGLPLAMTYKAVNTLDSMVGYKNEEYRDFGWASARLDDIANFIPARITGLLIVAATFIASVSRKLSSKWLKMAQNGSKLNYFEQPLNNVEQRVRKPEFSVINAFRIMIKDGRNHSSPNSGIPEAAIAGALGVQLGGPSIYGGVLVEKPFIGEEMQNTEHRTQTTEHRAQNSDNRLKTKESHYLKASEGAVTIIKITSFLGLLGALAVLYIRTAL
jgi:adenosylcobinamide-phosphate synthase